jgi:hypothetical protein
MTFDEFKKSTQDDKPPSGLSSYLVALWREKRGDWNAAHEIVQEIDDKNAAWVHAYLHRREGDEGNAGYWYRNAGKNFPTGQPLDDEWEGLVKSFLFLESPGFQTNVLTTNEHE